MTLRHWDPFADFRRMDEAMNRLWRGFPRHGTDGESTEGWVVPMDVLLEGENVLVQASLPGVDPKEIQVTIEDGVLTIRGKTAEEREHRKGYVLRERRTGSFYRSIRLPDSVDAEKAEPTYENGVISIAFPKLEAKKAKQLEIKLGEGRKGLQGGGS